MFMAALTVLFGMIAPNFVTYAAETDEAYRNPLIWADVPDPSVIRVGDVYYMTSTTMHMNPGVPIMKSVDLANWEIVNYVYDILEEDDTQSLRNGKSEYGKGSWASSLRYHDGTFYVTFSSSTAGKTYIYQTEDIENGPWERHELPFYHDMSLLFDDDGRVYMVSGNMNIRLTELTSDATAVKQGGIDKVIIENAISVTGGTGSLAEGAHIYKRNGYYYIFLIAWPGGQGRQQLLFRAEHIEGPYEGRVVFNDAGVAQGGIVDTPEGDWYAMLFQDHGAVGRIPYLVPVAWENDWPVFGDKGKLPATIPLPANIPSLPGIVSSDEFYQGVRWGSERVQSSPAARSTSTEQVIHIASAGSDIGPEVVLAEVDPILMASVAEAAGQEIIVNGNFEDGTASWLGREGAELTVVEDVYDSHNHVLEVTNRTTSGAGPVQHITDKVEVGGIYNVSAKVNYFEGPEEKTFNLSIQYGDSYEDIDIISSVNVKRGEWGTITGTLSVPEGYDMSKVTVFLETPWNSSQTAENDWMDFYVDDVSIIHVGSVKPEPEPEPEPEPSEEPDPQASNSILVNGSFEDELVGWYGRDFAKLSVIEDVYGAEGNHILYATDRVRTGSGPAQDVTDKLKPGWIYDISAKIRYTSGPDTKKFYITAEYGSEPVYRNMVEVDAKRGEWSLLSGRYEVPSDVDLSRIAIFLETPWRQQPDQDIDLMDFYVDDVKIVPVGPANNLIDNWSFEEGIEPWENREGNTITVTDADAASGQYSLHISNRSTTGGGPKQGLNGKIKAGGWYAFSAKVKYEDGPAQKPFIMSIQYNNADWQTIKNMGSATIRRGEWGTIEGIYEVPRDTDIPDVSIFLETPWVSAPTAANDLMDFYIDDVVITEIQNIDRAKYGEHEDNGSYLSPVWQWNHNPDQNNWSLLERPGYLRLKTGQISTSLQDARNTVSQRTFGPESGAVVALDISQMKNGDVAGLAAFSSRYGFVGVKRSSGKNSIIMVNNSSGTPQEVESIELNQDRVYLKVELDYKNRTDKGNFYYSLDGVEWQSIGNTLQMIYNLEHFMGYRFALFNYATQTTGGYVDFDYFRVSDRLTGTTDPEAILTASLGSVEDVIGVPNFELEVPIELDAVPEGAYDAIVASFNIPQELLVKDVVLDTENVSGEVRYKVLDNRLVIEVTGDKVGFSHRFSKVLATIKLVVKDFIPTDRTLELRTDYVRVSNDDIVFNVHDATAAISVKALDTEAIAKIPGYANPLITHKYGADPYALVYDGRVYLYMTGDTYVYDQNGNVVDNNYGQIQSLHVISSADLINWTDHGSIPVAGRNGIAKWASQSWAPAIAHKVVDGQDKFYLYFSNNASGVGVLEGDSPLGPWKDPRGRALIDRSVPGTEGMVWIFDPAVLVDDDGSAYLYFGGGIPGGGSPSADQVLSPKTARVVKLGEDMVSTVGEARMIDAPYMFENSGIHKYGDRYYYSYSTNFSGTRPPGASGHGVIDYMVSDDPMGPFTHIGTILSNPVNFFGVGGNNHHAIFEFGDRWYIAYHAQTVGQALGIERGYRSTHLNEVTFYENGYIRPIEADREGVDSVASLNPYDRIEAETIAWQAGIDTRTMEQAEGVNLYVTDVDPGDWIALANVDFGERGAAKLEASVSSSIGGTIEVRLDHPDGELIGMLTVEPTGGEWMTIETELSGVPGVHAVFFVAQGEGGDMFDIDYWKFTELEGDDNPPGDGDDNPPGDGDDNPPGDGDDNPPGDGDDNPPGDGDDNPPGDGDDNPPGDGDDNPPGDGDDNPPGDGDDNPPVFNPGPVAPGVGIIIDGRTVHIGSMETSSANGWRVTKLTLDRILLDAELDQAEAGSVISIPVGSQSDVIVARIDGGNIQSLAAQGGALELVTELGVYTISGQQILDAIGSSLDTGDLDGLMIEIEIGRATAERASEVETALTAGGLQLILPPVEFNIRVVQGNEVLELSVFGTYVERLIAIPDDVDPALVTTAVMIGSDGTVYPIPTELVQIDGRYYAKVNSLTNSTYAIVHYQADFHDITNHWAEDYILDLGSRKIVNGVGDNLFAPNAIITRAEFAGIVARGLGLVKTETDGASHFSDVHPTDWFYDEVEAATTYGLIDGYQDGTFRPHEQITREQAMAIIARAMKLTGLKSQLEDRPTDEMLRPYQDAGEVSVWAREAVASAVQSGIIVGRTADTLAPQEHLTRSEVAKMVQQLLELSDLI